MAAQAAMIDDTIIGLKRALSRQNPADAGLDEPINQPTNRGNKLRAQAQHVRAGALGYMDGQDYYRKKTEHAGYKRDILAYNPPRFDSEGDELDFDDTDASADVDAAEDNPYAEISLQDVLGPLKHPSQLAEHPSMSQPYTSESLKRMVGSVDKCLRDQRHALWQAKTLHRQLLGDASWIPCGLVETDDEDEIFGGSAEQLRGYDASADTLLSLSAPSAAMHEPKVKSPEINDIDPTNKALPPVQGQHPPDQETIDQDTEMPDAQTEMDNVDGPERAPAPPDEERTNDSGQPGPEKSPEASTERMEVDDETKSHMKTNGQPVVDGEPSRSKGNATESGDNTNCTSNPTADVKLETDGGNKNAEVNGEDDEAPIDGSPQPLRRMTTRAQANQTSTSQSQQETTQPSTPSLSGTLQSASDGDGLLPEPHPLFLLPSSLQVDRTCGLPQQEADETRHLLWAYIQKQEVTVRLFGEMLETLRKACRMKDDVWEWCKAEGHVGEMSDGEDWYDRQKWGLAEGEDLRKGADEDEIEVDEGRATGKRGRGRRN